jgi:hypothetical protein
MFLRVLAEFSLASKRLRLNLAGLAAVTAVEIASTNLQIN